jgi:Phosphotransferase enzyme family
MFVDATNVAHFLSDRQLLTMASVVAGDFMVVEQNSRNRNLKIVRRGSPGFFIKQIAQRTPEFVQSMAREAACYALAQHDPRFRALRSLMPSFRHFDPTHHILVVDLITHGESLWEYHRRVGRFPVDIATLQGDSLGTYHRHAQIKNAEGLTAFSRALPWILSLHETDANYLAKVSGGNSQLIEILQRFPDFRTALTLLKNQWNFSTLIHGDMKWENMMLDPTASTTEGRLKIIDWEIADLGDACWDVGGVFQAYLTFWIFSLPLGDESRNAATSIGAALVSDLKPALTGFWRAYARARRLPKSVMTATLVRSLACAAARIIQTAYESIQSSPNLSQHARYKLQVSLNILRDPQTAVADFVEV